MADDYDFKYELLSAPEARNDDSDKWINISEKDPDKEGWYIVFYTKHIKNSMTSPHHGVAPAQYDKVKSWGMPIEYLTDEASFVLWGVIENITDFDVEILLWKPLPFAPAVFG